MQQCSIMRWLLLFGLNMGILACVTLGLDTSSQQHPGVEEGSCPLPGPAGDGERPRDCEMTGHNVEAAGGGGPQGQGQGSPPPLPLSKHAPKASPQHQPHTGGVKDSEHESTLNPEGQESVYGLPRGENHSPEVEQKVEDGDGQGQVWALQQEGDFEAFIKKEYVAIVYFYRKSESTALTRFLREYSKSAQQLQHYRVLLAMVDCGEYQVASYCTSDKINRFAYGFRGGQEKIAFPLDTLFNNNAIVASALHLALINTVPILQTAGERRGLEARCRGRCDLIFTYLRTLGTLEHRTFLEVAHTYQANYVFAITTYTAGTLGLPPTPNSEEEQENGVWVIHCRDKTADQECVVSSYRGKIVLLQMLHFIKVLRLPLWHEVSMVPASQELVTPYDQVELPWVLLLHDSSSSSRVKGLAPNLAQLLHGSVAVITVNLEGVNEGVLAKLGLDLRTITTPALAFLQPGRESAATLLNNYDDALEWVREQLSALQQKEPMSKEDQGYLPVQVVEELQQDDEVVMGMVQEDSFPGVTQLAGLSSHNTLPIKSKKLAIIAFHLAWDPASNALLQHLSAVASQLEKHESQATIYSLNCFDWPLVCDSQGIFTYPVLRLHPRGRPNITYHGPINHHHILRAILLMERVTPVELSSVGAVEGMLALNRDLHPACSVSTAAVVGIFPTEKDSAAFTEASRSLEGSHLLARHISQEAVTTFCVSGDGCVVVSKPGDTFQPRRMLQNTSYRPSTITNFISFTSLPVLAQLDPERYAAVHLGGEGEAESLPNQHLIIVFLPSNTTSQPAPDTPHRDSEQPWSFPNPKDATRNHQWSAESSPELKDSMLTAVGQLAAEMSEPGFMFSWLQWQDPLAQVLGPVYGLAPGARAVVGVEVQEGVVHLFPGTNTTRPALREWLVDLRAGRSSPSVLPGRTWGPRLPGFNYLEFMQEDQDRDAEDHLVLEMEADLTTRHQQGERNEGEKHTHEEL